MLVEIREGYKKKVPLSRCLPPETGCGRINAPHGGRYYIALPGLDHKKANPARVGEHPSPVSNGRRCKYRDSFWKCKGNGVILWEKTINY